MRTEFQRDRDRVIHSRAFRRLEYKTQVFLNGSGDHLRTRLTHTMEVAGIARNIARALRLNEDLTEAIALAHDLGHSPFGHSGEKVLNRLMRGHGGFEHNHQSLRLVEQLEQKYPRFPGLNLTWEVREGLVKHRTAHDRPGPKAGFVTRWPSLEAQIANLADEIAYYSHDLDDGLAAGLLDEKNLRREVHVWKAADRAVRREHDCNMETLKTKIRVRSIKGSVDDTGAFGGGNDLRNHGQHFPVNRRHDGLVDLLCRIAIRRSSRQKTLTKPCPGFLANHLCFSGPSTNQASFTPGLA